MREESSFAWFASHFRKIRGEKEDLHTENTYKSTNGKCLIVLPDLSVC